MEKTAQIKGFLGFYLDKIGFMPCGQASFGATICGKQVSEKKVKQLVEKSQNDK